MSESYLERIALALIREAKLPEPIREFKFCDDRKWRCDFVWLLPHHTHGVSEMYQYSGIILEVEGAIWSRGRHSRGLGILADMEKYNEAALNGFMVIRVSKIHLINGQMIEWLKRALGNVDEINISK